MDLTHVDTLAIDNNAVNYLVFRQDLFHRYVDARGMKREGFEKKFRAFLTLITKKFDPVKFGMKIEQNLGESLKIFAKLKKYKFTLQ